MTLADERHGATWTVPGLAVDVHRAVHVLSFLTRAIGKPERFGPCGFSVRLYDSSGVCDGSVIVTQASHGAAEWVHASIARERHMPTYADLARLHEAVFGSRRFAYQVFASADRHVNIHARALHLWGRADGRNVLPDFGAEGTI
jgi:hypothetical protein